MIVGGGGGVTCIVLLPPTSPTSCGATKPVARCGRIWEETKKSTLLNIPTLSLFRTMCPRTCEQFHFTLGYLEQVRSANPLVDLLPDLVLDQLEAPRPAHVHFLGLQHYLQLRAEEESTVHAATEQHRTYMKV